MLFVRGQDPEKEETWKEPETQGDLNTLLPVPWREVSPSIQKPLVTRKYQAPPAIHLTFAYLYIVSNTLNASEVGMKAVVAPKGWS